MKFRTYLACPNIVSKIHFRPYLLIFVKKISLFKEYYVKITDSFITQLTYFHTPGHNPMSSKMVWKRYKIEYIKINLDELRYTSGRKQIYHHCSPLSLIKETPQRRKACPIFTWLKQNVILLISRRGLGMLARFKKFTNVFLLLFVSQKKKKKKVSTKEKRFYSFLFALSLRNTKKGNNQQISHVKTHITAMRRDASPLILCDHINKRRSKVVLSFFFFFFLTR